MRRIQTYVEGKTTANKTLAVLKDLGAKQVRYMFEEAFPIPAVQFPDLKKHDKIKRFAMSVTDTGQKFVSMQEVFDGFTAFCGYRGESTPAENAADMEKLMRECGVDPENLVESRERLQKFLNGEVSHQYRIEHIEGATTLLSTFKTAYRSVMQCAFEKDAGVFQRFGFRCSDTRVYVCKSCSNVSAKGCCAEYSATNRAQRMVIVNMKLSYDGDEIDEYETS